MGRKNTTVLDVVQTVLLMPFIVIMWVVGRIIDAFDNNN